VRVQPGEGLDLGADVGRRVDQEPLTAVGADRDRRLGAGELRPGAHGSAHRAAAVPLRRATPGGRSQHPQQHPVLRSCSRGSGGRRTRVRRPPRIADRAAPLRGLTITVDPGHPPGGATGPTTLYEADAVLQVGFKLRDMLTQAGANVVMTRTTPDPVDLGLRAIISRRANAHAFVSIHLNAFPDGVNPFVNNGSLTLYFWPHSIPLGVVTQAALLDELGLRDNGTQFQNIAVARGTWMPSILTEGAFVIMPDQEAALRTPAYQTAYATAILRGLQTYFASLAQAP